MLGGALPGGSIVSAAVSSGRHPCGKPRAGPRPQAMQPPGTKLEGGKGRARATTRGRSEIDVVDPLADGDYLLTLVVEGDQWVEGR